MIEEAIQLAATAHAGQQDKAGKPYILHPLRVMLACENLGEAAMCAAVLHDTVEDAGLELAYIRGKFGATVSGAVDALSRRDGESYNAFIDRCSTNAVALSVKLADIEDNINLSRLSVVTDADVERRKNTSLRVPG